MVENTCKNKFHVNKSLTEFSGQLLYPSNLRAKMTNFSVCKDTPHSLKLVLVPTVTNGCSQCSYSDKGSAKVLVSSHQDSAQEVNILESLL